MPTAATRARSCRLPGAATFSWPTWSRDEQSIYFIYTYQPWHTEQSEINGCPRPAAFRKPSCAAPGGRCIPYRCPAGICWYSGNPDSVDLALWWQPGGGGPATPLTTGIGKYTEGRISSDGRRLVSMVLDQRAIARRH